MATVKGNASRGGRGRPRCRSYLSSARQAVGCFTPGQEVMVRWSDGLFYQGKVLRVDEANERCQVKFADSCTFYVLCKDLHRGPADGEICCCVCQGESSEVPNSIVLCDSCGMGYHQVCHHPPIPKSVLRPHVPFVCKLCSFVAHLKLEEYLVETRPDCDGSDKPLRVPPNGCVDGVTDVHHVIPYRMNLLTWDAQHRTNVEQCYCYCGGPGDWYCKMLQCCRCRQWFHEACVGCLKQPLLYGDRFYMFLCSHCNYGLEFIRRLPFKWVDVVHLALFNLTLNFCHKYYDLHTTILPWISENANNLELGNLLQGRPVLSAEVSRKVEAAFSSHKSKFMSGREVKKKASLWALVVRVPPQAPPVSVPVCGPVNDEVMEALNTKGQKVKCFIPAQCQSPIPVKGLQRTCLDKGKSLMCRSPLVCSLLMETNNNNNNNSTKRMVNGTGGDNCYKGLLSTTSHSKNHIAACHAPESLQIPEVSEGKIATRSVRSNPRPPATPDKALPNNQNISPKEVSAVLDRLVPMPISFAGKNHPFRTQVEIDEEVQRVAHFQDRLSFLKQEYAAELKSNQPDAGLLERGSPAKKSPSPARGVKRGANGEDGVRRSKRSRVCAEQYQHLLSSFPRHRVSRQEAHPTPRWKWLSVVDQILYGEKFEILARRQTPDGSCQYLLEWDD